MAILYTVLGVLFGIFILHYVLVFATRFIKRKFKLYEIFNTGIVSLYINGAADLLVTIHYYSYDDEPEYHIMFEFGGFSLLLNYKSHNTTDTIERDYYFGFASCDYELIPYNFCWYKHFYNNPFSLSYFRGSFVYDMRNHKLINKNECDASEEDKTPYCLILRNTNYITKYGNQQKVNCIKWYICERSWTLPILHWLHLDNLYKMHHVDLEFISDTELGINVGSWKGGVMGSSIALHKESELYKLYMKATRKDSSLIQPLARELNNRINKFMTIDKLY